MLGLLDSGSGGLSVLRAIRALAPLSDIVYFGDIAHAPYGSRSPEELAALIQAGVAIVRGRGATEIVSACNSISAQMLAADTGAPVIEMSTPMRGYMHGREKGRVLLIATPVTVASHIYRDTLREYELDELPIWDLAGAIEFDAPEDELARSVDEAFAPLTGTRYRYLILGCTHYPLVRDLIERRAERLGSPEIIDPAEAVARAVLDTFDTGGSGRLRFLISKDSDMFRRRATDLFPDAAYTVEVV